MSLSVDLKSSKHQHKKKTGFWVFLQTSFRRVGTIVTNKFQSLFQTTHDVWTRELADGSYAIAFVNQRVDGVPYAVTFSYDEMKIPNQAYDVVVSSISQFRGHWGFWGGIALMTVTLYLNYYSIEAWSIAVG